ncbi:hypothetical protein BDD12DRAFT_254554 [Trichophaea hybrida]|nr:hypothetical protein BDD12DRAFT_254554 [Trichophaea hybrida]
MNRQHSEQAQEGYWRTPQLFPQHGEEEEQYYISSSEATQHHHHHHQRYTTWSQQQPAVPQIPWEHSEGLYPPHPTQGGSSSRESHRRHHASSPMGSPNLTSSEQDENGRFVCKYHECEARPEDRIFTRKSDWRRHNDKHTRPYRCHFESCKDLAGFGWVGGLNRHLEELHNSKAQHKCPYPDCKRHINGFSRPANLKNHMRKVHNAESESGGGVSATPSEAAGDSGPEYDPPLRSSKKLRQNQRTQDQILREIAEVEQEAQIIERELGEVRKRKMDALVRLEGLRVELEDVHLQEQAVAIVYDDI